MCFHQVAYEHNLQVVMGFRPALLWQWFSRISAIPHPSHHEEALATAIVDWATQRGLAARRDDVGNVIIKKNATRGYENRAAIALQAHLDMVPQVDAGVVHDFVTDPILLRVCPDDKAWLMATGTTLGADNGIGMASCLAVLEDETLNHPELEVLLTMTEETGMLGVLGLKAGDLTSSLMINTDTEEIGEVYIGCAGGIDADVSLPIVWQDTCFEAAIHFDISGLRGGHSGLDIHKNRGNAIKILAQILAQILPKFQGRFALATLTGGTLRNAIPRGANAILNCDSAVLDELMGAIEQEMATISDKMINSEPNLRFGMTPCKPQSQMLADKSTDRVIRLINALPSGVVKNSDVVVDTVETSVSFGQVMLANDQLQCGLLVRSLIESGKKEVCDSLEQVATLIGASVRLHGSYVGWSPDANSAIVSLTTELYTQILGQAPKIKVIHAGLECGLIKQSHPQMDIVSIGPTIKNAHSPDEMVHIDSVATYWQLLTTILANAPLKTV